VKYLGSLKAPSAVKPGTQYQEYLWSNLFAGGSRFDFGIFLKRFVPNE
jgi:hypothetical protein